MAGKLPNPDPMLQRPAWNSPETFMNLLENFGLSYGTNYATYPENTWRQDLLPFLAPGVIPPALEPEAIRPQDLAPEQRGENVLINPQDIALRKILQGLGGKNGR